MPGWAHRVLLRNMVEVLVMPCAVLLSDILNVLMLSTVWLGEQMPCPH